jgi:hypothetical protein
MLHTYVKDSMWQRIYCFFAKYFGTIPGVYVLKNYRRSPGVYVLKKYRRSPALGGLEEAAGQSLAFPSPVLNPEHAPVRRVMTVLSWRCIWMTPGHGRSDPLQRDKLAAPSAAIRLGIGKEGQWNTVTRMKRNSEDLQRSMGTFFGNLRIPLQAIYGCNIKTWHPNFLLSAVRYLYNSAD